MYVCMYIYIYIHTICKVCGVYGAITSLCAMAGEGVGENNS